MKKTLTFIVVLTLLFAHAAYAKTDGYIYSDPVANTYAGRAEASQLISNLRFTDMPADISSQDAIVRSGVLNMIKGYEPQYRPNAAVTKEEALAFVLRTVGLENAAQASGVALQATLPADSPLLTVWSVGYMRQARTMGLITAAQYTEAVTPDPSTLDPAVSFVRTAPATREELAGWLAGALQYVQPNIFSTTATQQSIYGYSDWKNIAADKINAVENLSRNHIMTDSGTGSFRPKASVTRLETALILRNMDRLHYDFVGLEKKTGVVAGLRDEQYSETSSGQLWGMIYVRTSNGTVDVLQNSRNASSSPQDGAADAVTLRNGTVAGLASLQEGDQIEYLVEPSTGTVWYVLVTGGLSNQTLRGRLQIINLTDGTITITDENEKPYTFPMAQGLYGTETDGSGYLMAANQKRPTATLPLGSLYDVTLVNNIVTSVTYVGEPELIPETRGIVTENNPDMGYITILDGNGREITKNYNTGSLRVQKTEYYDMRDTLGSIHSLFPDFYYNPRETDMRAIEPGDIVSFRTDPADSGRVISISASTNYTTRYGRIREFRTNGDVSTMLMQFENGGTAWFTVAGGIMISKGGRPVPTAEVQPGDWARLLVNQAVVAPGQMLESVKEITLEGDGHYISTIVKGKLVGFNPIQNKINLQDAQRLTESGWSGYRQIEQFDIAGQNIEYYYDGQPVTLSYVKTYLSHTDASVYLALENNYAGEKIRMVTFRSSRDELLKADTVLTADGNGGFNLLSNAEAIATDAGTIVRRNGRLVDGRQIIAPDYAVVSLNGLNTAAVVDITPAPATAGVMIARGRIYSVDQGRSFKVQSMSLFGGQSWSYTPIQREFSIDNNTLFMTAAGLTAIDEFIDYTDASVMDKVYNIVIDGGRAARVIDSPYVTQAVRGTIYAIDGNTVSLKDVYTYNTRNGRWSLISNRNATGTVTVPSHAVLVDRNQVVGTNALKVGQQIKVMTDTLPENITSGLSVTGYIILVER